MTAPQKQPVWDATTPSRLWPTLFRMVRHRFYWLDRAPIEDAVAAAILQRLEQDADFLTDAEKEIEEAILRSLYNTACREVGHMSRADKRRGEREREYARQKKTRPREDFFVANGLSVGNIEIEALENQWEQLLEGCCPCERLFLELRKEGCRNRTAYAKVLGMDRCPVVEQRRAVKRAWDRLLKKLQRRVVKLL